MGGAPDKRVLCANGTQVTYNILKLSTKTNKANTILVQYLRMILVLVLVLINQN